MRPVRPDPARPSAPGLPERVIPFVATPARSPPVRDSQHIPEDGGHSSRTLTLNRGHSPLPAWTQKSIAEMEQEIQEEPADDYNREVDPWPHGRVS